MNLFPSTVTHVEVRDTATTFSILIAKNRKALDDKFDLRESKSSNVESFNALVVGDNLGHLRQTILYIYIYNIHHSDLILLSCKFLVLFNRAISNVLKQANRVVIQN